MSVRAEPSRSLSFTVDVSNNFGGSIPDSFSLGILDSSGNGLPTTFFDAFMQIDITASPVQVTYANGPNTPSPSCPTCAPINLATPTVKTITLHSNLPLAAAYDTMPRDDRCNFSSCVPS